MNRRHGWVVAVAAATVLLAGCGASASAVDPAPVSAAERPRPVGVEENPAPPSTSAAPVPDCNARQSLRPGPLPPAGAMPGGSTMARIAANGKLVAGVDQNTFLFGFRDPSTNQLAGFDIDRVREVALAIFGGPPEAIDQKIQYKVISSAERIPALKNGEVDIVVRTFTANCARWADINFSAIYYEAGQRLLINKARAAEISSLEQLAGKKVCAARGSTSIARISDKKAVPVTTDTWSDCLVMLQQNQVEGVSTDDTILAGMVRQDPNTVIVGAPLSSEPYGIGIPKQNEDMVRFVNGVLEKSIRDGAWTFSRNRWTLGAATPPVPEYR
ncbi:MAG TPA: glutamate ABC transporter substrate-binding protein [Actinophytocola sp.]|uniref:glutamate ABC transporter substrate-binding protein n=1 Tax=Actinophytocola sp. TaxID=1872138 RepID=UPI002DBE2EB6|nr:glutamate ABC transporter substrate-binding protein [Actinophytocola sp.]HEU5469710.1 glutamate ABC transporter substrate-binding protein [Actinophytocola sp.]